jgi:hypothetical protein
MSPSLRRQHNGPENQMAFLMRDADLRRRTSPKVGSGSKQPVSLLKPGFIWRSIKHFGRNVKLLRLRPQGSADSLRQHLDRSVPGLPAIRNSHPPRAVSEENLKFVNVASDMAVRFPCSCRRGTTKDRELLSEYHCPFQCTDAMPGACVFERL